MDEAMRMSEHSTPNPGRHGLLLSTAARRRSSWPIKITVKEDHHKLEDKCLEASRLKEFKSQAGGDTEAGRELMHLGSLFAVIIVLC